MIQLHKVRHTHNLKNIYLYQCIANDLAVKVENKNDKIKIK